MNIETFEKLQLKEVKELIKEYCISSLGKELIDKLNPSDNFNIVKRRLSENKEARKILENSNHIPLEGLFNINPIIEKVQKGMILEPRELISMEDFLRGCRKIKSFMIDKEFYAPTLTSYALNITECLNIEEEINYSIKNNKVDSEASKELKKIRRNIEITEGRIKDRLNKFLTSSSNKKYIFKYINKEELLNFNNNKLENCDVFPYIYLKIFVEGIQGIDTIKHVVIDEMQDYTPVQYMVIKELYKCKKTILGDFGQCVNPYNSNSLLLLGDIFENSEVVKLNKSYRSTYEIIKFSEKILKQGIEPIERHGELPKIIKCSSLEEELKQIENTIDNFNKSDYSTMGIICKTKSQAKQIYDKLKNKYEVNLLDIDSLEFKEGIIISTIHMSKGLEFDEIIIPMVDTNNYNSDYDRNLLYIACTRAMHKLTLTYHDEITDILSNINI